MTKIHALLERWEKWLEQHLPDALDSLRPGANDQQIAEFEGQIGCELPDDVRAWFRWRDGQKEIRNNNLFFHFRLLSLEASLKEWKMWQEFADMNEEIAEDCVSHPAGSILAAYTAPGWIPLVGSGHSAYMGVDLNPGPQGQIGQVINFGRDEERKGVAGASWTDFIEFLVDELEAERIVVDDQGVRGHRYFRQADDWLFLPDMITKLHALEKFDGRRLRIDDSLKHLEE